MKTQNTFADGINMDVNPLVAPKTVMSNCLNGTLITYNGNENVLQNDMGNGKVADAYLPKDWVPVGMQEYGGIIYVAAYNPKTKESQLGSFPSPLQNFENNNADSVNFELKEGKYPLFNDKDLQLKPGNKLAVALASDLYDKVEQNFNNSNTEHKKRWSIRLCLLTSNGVLTDVTDNLSNLASPKEVKENSKYHNFFFLEDTAESLEKYLRIYSGTLVGTPYIQVAENLASSMDVELLPGIVDNKVQIKAKCTITSSSLLWNYKNELGLAGVRWSIDDGITSGHEELIPYDSINSINDSQEYTITIEFIMNHNSEINLQRSDKVTVKIEPIFNWGLTWDNGKTKYTPQPNLRYTLTFDIEKIGTGVHEINQWRYYYDEDFITLTWGMESYPALGEEVREVNMRFIGYDGNPINFGNTTLNFRRSTFNGEFTEVLDSKLFTYKFPYIAEITWQAGTRNFLKCRWIIPTPLYNDFYLSRRILDFSNPAGTYVNEFKAVNTIKGNILQFSEKPLEQVIDLGWEYFPIVSKNALNDRTITYTKIYLYTPKARLKVIQTSDYYPFTVNYSNVRDIRINDEQVGSISNYLTTTHDIKYKKVDNINVSKLFECHNEDFLNNYKGYMVFGVTRFRHKSSDENRLTMYAYDNEGHSIIDAKFIINEADDGTIRENLIDYWSSPVKTYLDNLLNLIHQYVIPVIFFAEDATGVTGTLVDNRALGLNYAIKKDGEWCLYWNREVWTKVSNYWDADYSYDYDKLRHFHLKNMFPTAPNTLYENRDNLPKPLPYLRCVSTEGSVVNGWLVLNNSTNITQDSEEIFKFNVKADATIRLVTTIDDRTMDYSEIIEDFINKWRSTFDKSIYEVDAETEKLRLKSLLMFDANTNITVELDYEFTNIKPGTYELCEQLENYKNYGVSTLVLYNGEYISPKDELDADGVYLYENGNFIDVEEATTANYKSFKYIVGSRSFVHEATSLVATVDKDSIKVNLIEIPTFNGSAVFELLGSDGSDSSELHPYSLQTIYGTGYDVNRDGIIDYWVILLGYYSNGAKRMLRGIDTDEDGKPDKWEEINPPRNE